MTGPIAAPAHFPYLDHRPHAAVELQRVVAACKGDVAPRRFLAALVRERGDDLSALSRMIGRNPAYIQQFVTRGSPRRLAEQDRRTIARYFGVDEALLGGPERIACGCGIADR